MEKICVAVRIRPPVSQESFNGNFWKVEENRISLHKVHGTPVSGSSYAFDHIFDENSTNASVYELLTKDIIHAAVEGFNGTAFAYGQTSSGKTFTMNGSETDPGVIPRAVKDIFGKIQMISDREFLIRVSYMEIYNEEINDLLVVENQKLQIHESLERGVFVAGLQEEIVNNAEQVLNLIKAGEVNRHFGETNMNARSSRSHTIFRMVIESKGKDSNSSDAVRVSVLNLVDLAGSERIAKTGAGGVRLKEGKYINKSLMVLGNVINKLSDGPKQRGHIPYRDSKLTRILQPALGGNAKTSIICTIAPEEVHVEETKGTLHFASRAKRITNCVQVNEILTDAALLKRQKLEIEELRRKLEGSHAEVLEQEVLKLRNDLLKYELDREKLETELEEERKSRDQWIREQQMKIENLGSLVPPSDCERNDSKGQDSLRHSFKDEYNDSNSTSKADIFKTPCLKAVPSAFVGKRSNYSTLPDYSPLPDAFSNVADEDMWLKMNKGYVADLDLLQNTPARKVQSFPTSDTTPGCLSAKYEREVQDLRRQLELATQTINELERKHSEQILLNKQLMEETPKLQQEARLIREIPQKLSESLGNFRDRFGEVLSVMQNFASDDKLSTAKVFSTMSEICTQLFATLEAHFSVDMEDERYSAGNNALIQEQHKVFDERLNQIVASLKLSRSTNFEKVRERSPLCNCERKGSDLGEETTFSKEKLSSELNTIKERYRGLEEDFNVNNRLLEVSKERIDGLEREFLLLKDERDSLLQLVSESSQRLATVTSLKENALKELNTEVQRRKNLEGEVKQFTAAFACRQRSLMCFHSEFKTKIEELRVHSSICVPKYLGCQD